MVYRRTLLRLGLAGVASVTLPGLALAKPASPSDKLADKIKDASSDAAGTTFELALEHAPFPDVSGKYNDDTVMVFVPAHYRLPKSKSIDFVVHFHGHNSMAKDVIVQHQLAAQLRESRQNAVLVVPQGPVNQPDGDFGKVMKKGGLEALLTEVREVLGTKTGGKKLGDASVHGAKSAGRILLSSHSGGYHAVASCLRGEGDDIHEVFLFDSLYDDVAAFRDWVTASKHKKLVSYYLGGKPKELSLELANEIENKGVQVVREENGERISRRALTKGRAVFMEGHASHVTAPFEEHAFRDCLFASCLHGNGSSAWLSQKDAPRSS